jgi:glutathione-regulated potassium-efflux system ancillary protein KefG
MATSVLIVASHPAYWRSRANRALRDAVSGLPEVTVHDLYETYPDFLIDVDAEQARLTAHGSIVLLHPFYWYSAPSLMKEWIDLVLELGWAYGTGGTALAGKSWMQAITTGGPAEAYRAEGYNKFSIPDLLRPFEATAGLCGCTWKRPFVVNGARTLDAPALIEAGERFRTRVLSMAHPPHEVATHAG